MPVWKRKEISMNKDLQEDLKAILEKYFVTYRFKGRLTVYNASPNFESHLEMIQEEILDSFDYLEAKLQNNKLIVKELPHD